MINRRLIAGLVSALMVTGLAGCSSSSTSTEADTSNTETQTGTVAESKAEGETGTQSDDTTAAQEGSTEATAAEEYTLMNLDVFSVKYGDYVDAANWRDAVVTKKDIEVSDYVLQYNTAYTLSKYGFEAVEVTDEDRTVQAGDTTTIDFVGYMDGEEFSGGSGTDTDLTIGSNTFIPGFEEGMVGMKKGEKRALELTFPEDYKSKPEYAGKAVTFDVTVKAIKAVDTSAITDEDMKTKSSEAYSSYEDFEKKYPESYMEKYINNVKWNTVMEAVNRKGVCEDLVNDFISTYLYGFNIYAQYYGVTLSNYLSAYGYASVDDFKEELRSTAEEYATQTCAVLAIAELEGIKADEEAVSTEYESALATYEGDEEKMKSAGYSKESFTFDNILDQVQKVVYSAITVSDGAEAKDDAPESK